MSGYTQLTQEERYQIYALMKAGHNQSEIAAVLGRDKSTISRELEVQPRPAGLPVPGDVVGQRTGAGHVIQFHRRSPLPWVTKWISRAFPFQREVLKASPSMLTPGLGLLKLALEVC